MKIVGMIPARYKSIAGKPMIQHVWERAKQARSLEDVIVATDDERVFSAVRAFGGNVEMTAPYHSCGTDRLAEVASRSDADFYSVAISDEHPCAMFANGPPCTNAGPPSIV